MGEITIQPPLDAIKYARILSGAITIDGSMGDWPDDPPMTHIASIWVILKLTVPRFPV